MTKVSCLGQIDAYHHYAVCPYHDENIYVINPFDTEHRAKTAVKFGILRVVMLWAS